MAKRLLDGKYADGSALTITGRTFAEEAARAQETASQEVIRPLDNPIKPTGGLVVLRGSLAPDGCVIKVTGVARKRHTGPARVSGREEDAMAAVTGGRIQAGDVVVIRYEGPRGGPGMREMLGVTGAIDIRVTNVTDAPLRNVLAKITGSDRTLRDEFGREPPHFARNAARSERIAGEFGDQGDIPALGVGYQVGIFSLRIITARAAPNLCAAAV